MLARILKLHVSDFSKLNNTIKQFQGNITHRLYYMSHTSQTVMELEFIFLQLEQEIIKIRQGLDVTPTGKLSPALLPPHDLSLLLEQVAWILLTVVALLAGTSIENMFFLLSCCQGSGIRHSFRDTFFIQTTPEWH
jgi:hypothetical protein